MGKTIRLQSNQTLREILVEDPGAYRVFEIYGIDYYCGGGRTVAEACGQSPYSLEELQNNLNRISIPMAVSVEEMRWYTAPLPELTRHIVSRHHAYLRKKLPELLDLAQKVADIHTEDHPETAGVLRALTGLREALEPHLAKEEEKLFPFLCSLEAAAEGKSGMPAGPPLEKTLTLVLGAHDHNNNLLTEIRGLTNGFNPPADACESFCRLWKGLRELEKDMHRHLHLENNILLPRALDLEKRIASPRT